MSATAANSAAAEREPLLPHQAREEADDGVLAAASPSSSAKKAWWPRGSGSGRLLSNRQMVTVLVFSVAFMINSGASMLTPALNGMMEQVICMEKLKGTTPMTWGGLAGGSDIDPRCKDPDVQGKLAMFRGWQTSLGCVPPVLLTLPYGLLADKIGRRAVLMLAITGLFLQLLWNLIVFAVPFLPMWTILLDVFPGFIGCFPSVAPAMMFTIIADVTPIEGRASIYFRFSATVLLADLAGNSAGGALLLIDNWVPLLVGSGLVGLAIVPVMVLMPETLGYNKALDMPAGAAKSVVGVEGPEDTVDMAEMVDTAETAESSSISFVKSVYQRVVGFLWADAVETYRFLLSNGRIMMLMTATSFISAGRFVQDLLLQYVTKRFHWTWSRAAFLLTVRSSTNLVLCLVVLPVLSTVCIKRWGIRPLVKDLWMARMSGLMVILGSLLIALAPSPTLLSVALVIFSCGGGFNAVLLSLLNASVEPHHQAMANSFLGLLEFSGLSVVAPAMFALLRKGIQLGGIWVGLPFMCASAVALLGTAIMFVFRLPPVQADGTAEEAETLRGETNLETTRA